jgi:acyl carrier protein
MSEVNSMTEKEVFAKIANIIEDRFNYPAEKVTNDLSFQDDLDADSIDIVEFVLELEDTFGAEISDDDAEKLATVGQAVSYISAHQKD